MGAHGDEVIREELFHTIDVLVKVRLRIYEKGIDKGKGAEAAEQEERSLNERSVSVAHQRILHDRLWARS